MESTWPLGSVRLNNEVLQGGKTPLDFSSCVITCAEGGDEIQYKFERELDRPVFNGEAVSLVPIPKAGIIIGRGYDNKGESTPRLCLDPELQHLPSMYAEIRVGPGDRYVLINRCADSALRAAVNGSQAFDEHELIFGDCVQVAQFEYYTFQFNGEALLHVGGRGHIQARDLGRLARNGRRILAGASLDLPSGAFVGVLGGSGQGKSTLMKALCGLSPASEGGVWIDGRKIEGPADMARVGLGYVPQEDIVHRDLTVRDALMYGTRLRVKLPHKQLVNAIDTVLRTLELTPHQFKPVRVLSGGQCKRVSIASELIMNPRFLFLDEPTSGLDPATEQKLMAELHRIAKNRSMGVLCTTHVLQNSYLFSSVLFIQGGRIIFQGRPSDAARYIRRTKFGQARSSMRSGHSSAPNRGSHRSGHSSGVSAPQRSDDTALLQQIPEIYADVSKEVERRERLLTAAPSSQAPAGEPVPETIARELQEAFEKSEFHIDMSPVDEPLGEKPAASTIRRPGILSILGVLLVRQARILLADPLNYLFLLGQAVIIGGLVGWVSDNLVFQMFITVIATLWFGCSNGAQEIVGELPIFRRERLAGLGLNTYLLSKFIFRTGITAAQSLILFLVVLTTQSFSHQIISENQEKYDAATEFREFAESFFGVRDGKLPDESPSPTAAPEAAKSPLDDFVVVDASNYRPPPPPPVVHYQNPTGLHVDDSQFVLMARLAKFFRVKENIIGSIAVRRVEVPVGQPIPPGPRANWVTFMLGLLALRLAALLVASLCGVALGLLVSASVRTETQAVMWVPLILIPQILFGSFVITVPEMDGPVRAFSQLLPSYSVQQIMDVANLYGREMPRMTNKTKVPAFLAHVPYEKEAVRFQDDYGPQKETYERISEVNKSWQNLAVRLPYIGARFKKQGVDSVEGRSDVLALPNGIPFKLVSHAQVSAIILAGWILGCYVLMLINLSRRQTT